MRILSGSFRWRTSLLHHMKISCWVVSATLFERLEGSRQETLSITVVANMCTEVVGCIQWGSTPLYGTLVNRKLPYMQSLYVMQWKSHKRQITCLYTRKISRTMLISETPTPQCTWGFKDAVTTELLVSLSTWNQHNLKGWWSQMTKGILIYRMVPCSATKKEEKLVGGLLLGNKLSIGWLVVNSYFSFASLVFLGVYLSPFLLFSFSIQIFVIMIIAYYFNF